MEYKANRAGIWELLSRDSGVSAHVRERAEAVADRARASAPVGKEHGAKDGARLKDSIVVVEGKGSDGRSRARVVVNKNYAAQIDMAWLRSSLSASSAKARPRRSGETRKQQIRDAEDAGF